MFNTNPFNEFSERIERVTNPLPGYKPLPVHYKFSVKAKYEGLKILDFLTQYLPMVNKNVWIEKIANELLTIDGVVANANSIVYGGNIIKHTSDPRVEPNVSANIKLLHYHPAFIVINKPAPLPMHPSGRFNRNTLIEILKLAFPNNNFKIIHRLDANTTGLVFIGLNQQIVQKFTKQFEKKQVLKEYVALVEGIVKKNTFNSMATISTEKTEGGGRKIGVKGDEAYTEFEVIKRYEENDTTLLRVIPHSGKTNQIRLHLAELGYPIVGDIGYKDKNYFKTNPLTYNTDCLFLHAWKATLINPITEKIQVFEAPIPEKFSNH